MSSWVRADPLAPSGQPAPALAHTFWTASQEGNRQAGRGCHARRPDHSLSSGATGVSPSGRVCIALAAQHNIEERRGRLRLAFSGHSPDVRRSRFARPGRSDADRRVH